MLAGGGSATRRLLAPSRRHVERQAASSSHQHPESPSYLDSISPSLLDRIPIIFIRPTRQSHTSTYLRKPCDRHLRAHLRKFPSNPPQHTSTSLPTMARKAIAKDQIVKLIVGAGQASPSPPVGPALGSKGVKSMDFCKVRLAIFPGCRISSYCIVAYPIHVY